MLVIDARESCHGGGGAVALQKRGQVHLSPTRGWPRGLRVAARLDLCAKAVAAKGAKYLLRCRAWQDLGPVKLD